MVSGAPFEILESKDAGRYVIARTSLSVGTPVLETKPYAFGVFDAFRKRICAECLASTDSQFTLHCRTCDQVYFCSARCFKICLGAGHHRVCKAYRKLATHKAPTHEKGVLKIVLSILYTKCVDEGKHLDDSVRLLESVLGDMDESAISIQNDDISGDTASSSWIQVDSLQSHFDDWPEDDIRSWRKTKQFIAQLLFESSLIDSDTTDFLMHLISKVESNCFGVYSGKGVCMGRAVYPTASYFNVSHFLLLKFIYSYL